MSWEVRTMRSVTSYFNPTLYKKNLTRFWPIWTVWTIFWAFLYPLNLLNQWRIRGGGGQNSLYRYFRDCLNLNGNLSEVAVVFGAGYGVLVAMAVFSYLYNHRSAAALHALPMRRETHFVTNYLSGLTFILLPNLLVYLPAMLVEFVTLPGSLSALALPGLWSSLWLKTGAELFFYSFAVFCAQFTGNIFALPAFYVILNGLVAGLYALVRNLGDQILYGGWPLSGDPAIVKLLTPIYSLTEACGWDYVSWSDIWNTKLDHPEISPLLELKFDDPGMVAGYALAGVVFAALALLVYRRRNIETAGDVVSVKIVRPIFRAGVAVCAGLSGGIFTAAFFGEMDKALFLIVCVAFWTAVGHYIAEMLLQKSFRVWKKAWKSCAATALVMVLVMTGLYMDVLGVETWTPDPDKVEEMVITVHSTYPYDSASYLNVVPEDGAGKERIVNIHEAIIRDYEEHGRSFYADELGSVNLTYTMKNGATYSKRYYNVMLLRSDVNVPGTTTNLVHELVNDRAVLEKAYGWEQALNSHIKCTRLENVARVQGAEKYVEMAETGEGAEEIWAAVQADFNEGKLGVRYLFDDEVRRTQTYMTDLELCFWSPERVIPEEQYYYDLYEDKMVAANQTAPDGKYVYNWSFTITLTPQAERTLAALEKYYDLGGAYELVEH